MNVIHAFSRNPHIILLHNVPRHADERYSSAEPPRSQPSGSDFGVFPDRKRSDDLRTGADHNIVLQRRMTFPGLLTITAERHALIQRHVVSDNGCFSDNHTRTMIQ